jgi:hypothetical protein
MKQFTSHWICWNTGEPFVSNLDKFGFVYIITNTQTGKAYVGCKQYYIGRTKKKHKWETYMSSSKYLKADIEKIGKKHFTFEVIAEYKNKRSLRYYEAYYQMKWNVLTATMEDSDEPAYYNSYVGGKFYRPIESYKDPEYLRKLSEANKGVPKSEEHKRKIGEAKLGVPNTWMQGEKHYDYKGKAELYLDGKRIVVDCLGGWAVKNGYNKGNVMSLALTSRDGFYKDNSRTSGKRTKLSCNGPLGIITKAKWLSDGKQ